MKQLDLKHDFPTVPVGITVWKDQPTGRFVVTKGIPENHWWNCIIPDQMTIFYQCRSLESAQRLASHLELGIPAIWTWSDWVVGDSYGLAVDVCGPRYTW